MALLQFRSRITIASLVLALVFAVVLVYGAARAFDIGGAGTSASPESGSPLTPPPGATIASTAQNPCPGCPIPGAIQGTVVGREGNAVLVQLGTPAVVVRLRPAPDLRIGGAQSWESIRTGDAINATGEVGSDNVVTVSIIDVNVTQVWGTIAVVLPDSSWLISPDKRNTDPSIPTDGMGRIHVKFDSNNTPVGLSGTPIPSGTLLAAKPGDVVNVVGVRPPTENTIVATKLVNFP